MCAVYHPIMLETWFCHACVFSSNTQHSSHTDTSVSFFPLSQWKRPMCKLTAIMIRENEQQWLCLKSLPIQYIVHYIGCRPFCSIGCRPFCSGVRILSERHHSLHSFTTFTHNPLWIRVYIRCTLAEALFPTIQCGENWARMKVRREQV